MTITNSTPVDVFFDVDGVFNALDPQAAPKNWGWSPESLKVGKADGLQVCWSSEFVDAVNHFSGSLTANENDHKIHWLTTWRDNAPDFGRAVGLVDSENWLVHHGNDDDDWHNWWKLTVVQNHHRQHPERRIVWIDDDIFFDPQSALWLKENPSVAWFSPKFDFGVTKEMWENILGSINS